MRETTNDTSDDGVMVETAYDLIGDFVEVCDCFTLCPCWLDQAPDEGECTGVFGWSIDDGSIGDCDVAGHRVVSVSYHAGSRHDAHQKVVLFIDQEASDEQVEALSAAFTGDLGGPLGELARLLGTLVDVRRAVIEIERTAATVEVSVGSRVRAAARALVGATGRTTALNDGALAITLGSPATVGTTERLRVDLPGAGIDVDVRGRSATMGRFEYHHSTTR